MSVDHRNVIDAIGIEVESGEAVLSITDHLSWTDVPGHLQTLQDKINDYVEFIESGQIVSAYPNSADRKLRIDVHFIEAAVCGEAQAFLSKMSSLLAARGYGFKYHNRAG